MMQLLFFSVSALVLLSGHALFWYILVRLFNLHSFLPQIAAAVVLGGLYLSAILATYFIHKWDNAFTRAYYIFACLWLGFLVNLILVAAVILAGRFALGLAGYALPAVLIKSILFGGGLIISTIAVYRAMVPVVKTYEVGITNLPEAWEGKTVVQLSDVHLGPVYRQKFFRRVIERINRLEPDAVFITGDLYDGVESDFTWMNHPFKELRAVKGIYYGFGNHDLYLGFNRVMGLLSDNPVTVLDDKMVVVDGLQIIGINYAFNNDFDLEKAILEQVNYSAALPSVLLLHAPQNIDLAKKAGIDLQLSGHTHDGQMFPFNYLTKWAHKGYGYGFFEEGEFSLVVTSGAGTWGPPMRTSARAEIVRIILKKK